MFGNLQEKQNAAEKEYLNSQSNIASVTDQQAQEKSNDILALEAQDRANKQAENEKMISKATVDDANQNENKYQDTLNRGRQAKIQNYETHLRNVNAERDAKNKLVMSSYQLASDKAKKKYQLAAQKVSQAQATWDAAGKIISSLGCVVTAVCPVAGLAISAVGIGVGAIGAAQV